MNMTAEGCSRSTPPPSDFSSETVLSYLLENPTVLEKYVSSYVTEEQLETWLNSKRRARLKLRNGELSCAGCSDSSATTATAVGDKAKGKDKRQHIQKLIKNMQEKTNQIRLMEELASSVAIAIAADGHNLYLVNEESHTISFVSTTSKEVRHVSRTVPVGPGSTVAAYVAHSHHGLKLQRPLVLDGKYPLGMIHIEDDVQSLISQPIMDADDNVMGVLEFYRLPTSIPFNDFDEQLHRDVTKQRKLNDFLLAVTKNIFQDIVSMDTVIMKIMDFAKKLVKADRASLFLLDTQTKELYARIFDTGSIVNDSSPSAKEIRFPMDKGVAGYVASTGQTLNITDAYSDERFNREVDLKTGYKTKTILCMPICIRGNIIGVVQMVNKLHSAFTKADEESFETFAVYCGLALHHAKLYDKIRKSEQKYKVALEVLSYHNQCSEEEYLKLRNTALPAHVHEIERFDFSPWHVSKEDKPLYVVYMFKELFADNGCETMFNMSRLAKFTLTIRKNYRKVPYHNWDHAFSVAHAMYAILKTSDHRFSSLEALGLFVACLCHDLDHRGKTNAFMVKSASPLAAIYTTSVMEHHHFNQTVSILQQDGHNIFKELTSEEYKTILRYIKECILATDLALFFGNKARLKELVDSKQYNWQNEEHRCLTRAIAMTGSDLCASTKVWDIQLETVRVIFEEFYAQGDEEKSKGLAPIAMMDRDKADQLPQSQVGFIIGICLPCYEMLVQILPSTKPMLDGASDNLKKWQQMAEKNEKVAERRELGRDENGNTK